MRLTSKQVAQKLGISSHTVLVYRDKGLLIDMATRKEGATKHYSEFDSKQVNEFAKTFKPKSKIGPRSGVGTDDGSPMVKPSAGILSRLEKIEDKLDALLAIWQ